MKVLEKSCQRVDGDDEIDSIGPFFALDRGIGKSDGSSVGEDIGFKKRAVDLCMGRGCGHTNGIESRKVE